MTKERRDALKLGGFLVAVGLFIMTVFYMDEQEDRAKLAEREAEYGNTQTVNMEDANIIIYRDEINQNICYGGVHAVRFDCVPMHVTPEVP